jgi:cytochrome c5
MFIQARTVKNMIKRNARRHAALSVFGMLVLSSNMVIASGDSTRGYEVYEQDCWTCHTPGVGGAPKLGDKDDWGLRVKKGIEFLNTNAINGYFGALGIMPPKGGRHDLPDEDIRAAVAYILENSK